MDLVRGGEGEGGLQCVDPNNGILVLLGESGTGGAVFLGPHGGWNPKHAYTTFRKGMIFFEGTERGENKGREIKGKK